MKISRRTWLQLLGGAALTGCGDNAQLIAYEDDYRGDDGDGGWFPGSGDGVGPDQEYDADAGVPDEDGGTELEEPGDDAGTELDAGSDLGDAGGGDAGSPDAGTLDGGASTSDAGTALDSGVKLDAGVKPDAGAPDAGTAPIADFVDILERPTKFPLGVMAGDATSTSIMFWTKYVGTGTLRLRVYEMNGSQIVATRFNGTVQTSAGFVRAIVSGLRPNKLHRYAFLMGSASAPSGRSAIGRVRTAFDANGLLPLKFAATSCTNAHHAPLPTMKHAGSRRDLAFFIHGGDNVYCDMGAGGTARTLADYRDKYDDCWRIPGLKALHPSTGLYKTWDDHEVFNNWDPETVNPARLANARQAFFENNAIRRNTVDPNRLWRSFRWGKTAELFILDCRSERKPSTRSANPAGNSTYISRAQMNWLKKGLLESPAVFKFIVNSVPLYNRPGPNSAGGDNWLSYASQRDEIFDHIHGNGLKAVVWISGDVHYGGVTTVERSGPLRNQWEVIVGPGGANSANPPNLDPAFWPARAVEVHNYTVFDVDPVARRLKVEYVNEQGQVISGGRWTHVF